MSDNFKRFAFIVAEGIEYESEYDGRVSYYCGYCGVDMNEQSHDSDCDMLEARKVLGQEWLDFQKAKQERIEKQKSHEIQTFGRSPNIKLTCQYCGKKIYSETGLRQHQADNKKCLKLQHEVTVT